jgi:hypothetical protein
MFDVRCSMLIASERIPVNRVSAQGSSHARYQKPAIAILDPQSVFHHQVNRFRDLSRGRDVNKPELLFLIRQIPTKLLPTRGRGRHGWQSFNFRSWRQSYPINRAKNKD